MNSAKAANLQLRLAALEIDLRSALALSEALLRAMSASSPQMHHAIDRALDDTLKANALEERQSSVAVHAIVTEVRERLGETGLHDRMTRDLERLIIEKASTFPNDGGIVIERDFESRNTRRAVANSF